MILSTDILNYKLKGYFINYRTLKYFLNKYNGIDDKEICAFQAPLLEYQLAGFEKQTIELDFADIHLLNGLSDDARLDHVTHCINASINDPIALEVLKQERARFYTNCENQFKENILIESDCVVPSSTSKKYSIHQVSHKGASLLELTQEGYPVPDFCILTSNTYKLDRTERNKHVLSAIKNLEALTGQQLGSIQSPLVFAMRCATSKYIPGLMPTYLNVGVTQDTFLALKEQYGYHVASKIYLYNLQTLYHLLYPELAPPIFSDNVSKYSFRDVYSRIQFYYGEIEKKDRQLLTDAVYQIFFLIDEVHRFYVKNTDLLHSLFIRDKSYPSFILQKMVWTVRDKNSYPGVLYSAHSKTGIGRQIESYPQIFGEEIMTGAIEANDLAFNEADELIEAFPAIHHFLPRLEHLEKKLQSPVTVEFAAESYKEIHYFALLQLNASELTGRATLLSAINLLRNKVIRKERVLSLVHPYHKRQIFSESIDDGSLDELQFFSSGVSVLPRLAVSCQVFFSAEKAIEAKKTGANVCLCKDQFVPADTMVMSEIDAILSLNPAAIHVVTACLSYGVPAFLNLEDYHVKLENNQLKNSKGLCINEGDWITISSKYQTIYLGKARFIPARFERYLKGELIKLSEEDELLFIRMAAAYKEYTEIIKSLATSDITNLKDLIKVIRTDLKNEPVKAAKFMNSWYDTNRVYYITQVMLSGLGMHKDQSELYNLLSTERKIDFFKKAIEQCATSNLAGFKAGAFMLGRFLAVPHPVAFWRAFYSTELIYMLNEILLHEKYQQLLYDVGERNLSRAKSTILTDGLGDVNLNPGMLKKLVSLKLSKPDWHNLNSLSIKQADKQLQEYLTLLQQPYSEFFDYEKPWSISTLQRICKEENLEIPMASTY